MPPPTHTPRAHTHTHPSGTHTCCGATRDTHARTRTHAAGINPDPVDLWKFRSKADLSKWHVFTDAAFGGDSRAALDVSEDGKSAVFSGRYSKALGDSGHLVRSGYCGINYVRSRNINLCMHDYLDFRVRGDGHTYVASVRSDQLTGGDEEAWQAPLHTA
jgi:NADH dehydrogenase [ubiquinone] 1 alpha subcomplex assembly factor 1